MFCPKCNQQQPSEETRFCSRCGFLLTGVTLLLNHEGILPVSNKKRRGPSRKKIMLESSIFTIAVWIVGIFTTLWFDFGGPLELVAKIGALLFFSLGLIGVLRFLYGFLFAKDIVDPTGGLGALRHLWLQTLLRVVS